MRCSCIEQLSWFCSDVPQYSCLIQARISGWPWDNVFAGRPHCSEKDYLSQCCRSSLLNLKHLWIHMLQGTFIRIASDHNSSKCRGPPTVDALPTLKTMNDRILLLLSSGQYGMLRVEDAERAQVAISKFLLCIFSIDIILPSHLSSFISQLRLIELYACYVTCIGKAISYSKYLQQAKDHCSINLIKDFLLEVTVEVTGNCSFCFRGAWRSAYVL